MPYPGDASVKEGRLGRVADARALRRLSRERRIKARSPQEIARVSLLGASALLLGYLESMLALPMVVPGFKLGIANIAVLVAFVLLGARAAFSVGLVKALATGLLFGSPMMLAYSFAGTACAFAGMAVVLKTLRAGVVSAAVLSAVLHNFAQVCVAAAFLSTFAMFSLLPVLGLVGCVTGCITGALAEGALRVLDPRRPPVRRLFAGRFSPVRRSASRAVAKGAAEGIVPSLPSAPFAKKGSGMRSRGSFEPWSFRLAVSPRRKAPRFLEGIDPRVLVVSFFAMSAVVCVVSRIFVLATLLGVTAACIIASGIGIGKVVRAAAPLIPAVAFVSVFGIAFSGGDAAFSIGPFSIGEEGLRVALRTLLSFACLISASVLFSFSVSASDVADAVGAILSPLRIVGVDVTALALGAGMTMRFASVLAQAYSNVAQAHCSRGAIVSEGAMARVFFIASCIVPVFASALRTADRLAVAMECRAYRPGSRRTSLKARSFGGRDAAVLVSTLSVCGAALALA